MFLVWRCGVILHTALEATQRQMDGFFCQLPYKCYLEEVGSLTYDLPSTQLHGGLEP